MSGFKDEELFERLFTQRNSADPHLKRSAEIFSLVYSFEGIETHHSSELAILGSLIGKSINDLYRDIAELINRDLVQSRSVWRAVLPQAIANRLAKSALKTIPLKTLDFIFQKATSERLLKSFSRRLSYLHDSDEAVLIVNSWLEKDGFLGELINLDYQNIFILENIAPVSPKKVLDTINRAAQDADFVNETNRNRNHFLELLRLIAYDREYFSRCVRILCQFALAENGSDPTRGARKTLKPLFFIKLSGTHAPLTVRYSIIEELITSPDFAKQDLGLLLLDAALETYFRTNESFDFGARPRDSGYYPQIQEDVVKWYGFLIRQCVDIILYNQELSSRVKTILASKFRDLWTQAEMHDELQDAAYKIKNVGSWLEGWVEVRETIYFEEKEGRISEKLGQLSELLQPIDLTEKIKVFGLPSNGTYYAFIEDEDEEDDVSTKRWERIEQITFDLALQLAQDELSLNSLIPELVSTESIRAKTIGRGLARGSKDKKALWFKLRDQLALTAETNRDITVLEGFILELAQIVPKLSNQLLDEIPTDSVLRPWFPHFQATVRIDQKGVNRLLNALDKEIAPIKTYIVLRNSLLFHAIDDHNLVILLLKILSKKGGEDIALDILHTRIRSDPKNELTPELILAGREILTSYTYLEYSDRRLMDKHLSNVAKVCLAGEEAIESTICIGQNLLEAYRCRHLSVSDFDNFLFVIAELQPTVFLDIFVGSDTLEENQRRNLFSNYFEKNRSALNHISDLLILSWCDMKPATRYERISYLIGPFFYSQETSQLEWKPITKTILEKAPNVEKILYALSNSIWPTSSWSNSQVESLQQRLPLFESLFQHANAEVSAWASRAHMDLQAAIIQALEHENDMNRQRNESFE